MRLRLPALSRGPAGRPLLAGLVLSAAAVIILNHPVITVIAFCLGGTAVLAAVLFRSRRVIFLLSCGLAAGLCLGAAQTLLLSGEKTRAFSALPTASTGGVRLRLEEDSVLTPGGLRRSAGALLRVSDRRGDVTAAARGLVAVYAAGGERLFWGEVIDVEGRLRPASPGTGTDFTMSTRPRGIRRRGFTGPLLEIRAAAVNTILSGIERLGRPASTLLEALLLGVKDELDFDLKQSFARTGSLHLLALSGLHVGVIGAIILLALSPLRSRKIKVVLAALAVGAYYFLAGPSPSLTRAVIMLCLAGVGYLLDRKSDPLRLLLISAVIILVADPAAVRTLSFQLSYTALAGILTLGRRLDAALIPWLPRGPRALAAASFSAQVFTAPIVLAAFGSIYPVGIVASPVLIPLTTVFVWSGLACLVLNLTPLAVVNDFTRLVMNLQYGLIRVISEAGARAPDLTVPWPGWFWPPAVCILACLAVGIKVQKQHELRLTLRH